MSRLLLILRWFNSSASDLVETIELEVRCRMFLELISRIALTRYKKLSVPILTDRVMLFDPRLHSTFKVRMTWLSTAHARCEFAGGGQQPLQLLGFSCHVCNENVVHGLHVCPRFKLSNVPPSFQVKHVTVTQHTQGALQVSHKLSQDITSFSDPSRQLQIFTTIFN